MTHRAEAHLVQLFLHKQSKGSRRCTKCGYWVFLQGLQGFRLHILCTHLIGGEKCTVFCTNRFKVYYIPQTFNFELYSSYETTQTLYPTGFLVGLKHYNTGTAPYAKNPQKHFSLDENPSQLLLEVWI